MPGSQSNRLQAGTSMKRYSAATSLLKRKLGARVVRTDAEARHAASFDSSKLPFPPAARDFHERVQQHTSGHRFGRNGIEPDVVPSRTPR